MFCERRRLRSGGIAGKKASTRSDEKRGHTLTLAPLGITCDKNVLLERFTTTTITVKGQVTLPKKVRDEVGLKPGDKVEVRATASGGVYIEKPGASDEYKARL
jgi:AbrB family looped-hinge helix DNA binding protein